MTTSILGYCQITTAVLQACVLHELMRCSLQCAAGRASLTAARTLEAAHFAQEQTLCGAALPCSAAVGSWYAVAASRQRLVSLSLGGGCSDRPVPGPAPVVEVLHKTEVA